MATTELVIDAEPALVFAVLADGWTYSDWVVGTAHIRDVDPDWPEVGARLHHTAGPWPISVEDTTTILECEPDRLLSMKLRLWPLGAGRVRFVLTPVGEGGTGGGTKVTMHEEFSEGPLQKFHTKINDVALHLRNRESLRRLADLAARRVRTQAGEHS